MSLTGVTVAVLLVALLGIPHGALDPWVARRKGLWVSPWQGCRLMLVYLGIAVAVVVIWQFLPLVSLMVFLLLSAWHFSGDHPQGGGKWAFGTVVLAWPLLLQTGASQEIFEVLIQAAWPLWFGLSELAWILVMSGLLMLLARQQYAVVLELLILGALAALVTPLWYFVVYFCFLHSPRHLYREFLSCPSAQRLSLFLIMLLFTALTLALAALSWVLLPGLQNVSAQLLQWLFIGLAALTVPHMLLLAWPEYRHD